MNMTIAITGHLGLIGSRIFKELKKTQDVVGIDKDDLIVDETALTKTNLDCIIHCASYCVIRDMIKDPSIAFKNVENYASIYEIARQYGCKKIILFSSSRVAHSEKNPYTASKIYGEELAEAYRQCYGIDTLIIRPETVWALNDKHQRVIPDWIIKSVNGESITVYGDENKELPPIHVDSFVSEFLKIYKEFMENNLDKKVFSISGKSMKVSEIIKIVEEIVGYCKPVYKNVEKTQPQQCIPADIVIDDFKEKLKEELE